MLRNEHELQGKIQSFLKRKDAQHPELSDFADSL
jgi:hypothetical protein